MEIENIQKKIQIVVARYNENLNWLIPFKDICIIYNKGDNSPLLNNFYNVRLPNYGRESQTYLYHIVNNYDNLAEKTIFFQGRIDDHKITDIESYFNYDDFSGKINVLIMNSLKKKIDHYGKWKDEYNNGSMKISKYTPFDWIKNIIGIEVDDSLIHSNVVWGANFSISKKLILQKPKIFYQNILRFLDFHINPEEGHFLERAWYLIFNNNYVCKKIIGYVFVENENISKVRKLLNEKYNDKYEKIHIWTSIQSNYEVGLNNIINYIPNNNKYLTILPKIYQDNNAYLFDIKIKCKNDAHFLIKINNTKLDNSELDNSELDNNFTNKNEYVEYEIVLGGWNNTKSIIREYNKNTTLAEIDTKILEVDSFINFKFSFSDKIKILFFDTVILEVDNPYIQYKIDNIKIKSYFGSESFWEYESYNNDFNIINAKSNLFLTNNMYDDQKTFYNYHFLNYYIEKIDLIDYF
jgi:hypothetical protein